METVSHFHSDLVNEINKSTNVTIGPVINCDNVDTINTNNHFVLLNCNEKNPFVIILSNTFSFVFGTLLDNICCCITSVSQRALMTAFLTLLVVGSTTGGIIGINTTTIKLFETFSNSSL